MSNNNNLDNNNEEFNGNLIDFVECGGYHTMAITFNNRIFCTGWN